MTELEIAISIIGLLEFTFIGWAVWVTKNINRLDKEVALNSEKDNSVIDITNKMNGKLDLIDLELKSINVALAKNQIDVKP